MLIVNRYTFILVLKIKWLCIPMLYENTYSIIKYG